MAKEVQTLVFRKDESPVDIDDGNGWTVGAAKGWAKDHDFRSDKIDDGETEIRLRQFDPSECRDDSFSTLTEGMPVGVRMVSCERDRSQVPEEFRRQRIERRYIPAADLRFEMRGEGKRVLVGHAAVFDRMSEPFIWGREKIAAGAFAESIGRDDVRALWNHDMNFVLGRTRSGTLRLSEDGTGLLMENDPPETQTARDLFLSPIERGDVTQMSFAFDMWGEGAKETWEVDSSGENIRTIVKVARLYDVSPVTYPAYPDTDVQLRHLMETDMLDLRALSRVAVRRQHGIVGLKSDEPIVRDAIRRLQELLPEDPRPALGRLREFLRRHAA